MVLRVLKGIEERNSLSGKEVARSGSDSRSKICYNGELLAGASHKGDAMKAGQYRGKLFNTTLFSTEEEKVMSDDWSIYNAKGEVVFEIEFLKPTNPHEQKTVVFVSQSGEKLGELITTVGEGGEISFAIKRIY